MPIDLAALSAFSLVSPVTIMMCSRPSFLRRFTTDFASRRMVSVKVIWPTIFWSTLRKTDERERFFMWPNGMRCFAMWLVLPIMMVLPSCFASTPIPVCSVTFARCSSLMFFLLAWLTMERARTWDDVCSALAMVLRILFGV